MGAKAYPVYDADTFIDYQPRVIFARLLDTARFQLHAAAIYHFHFSPTIFANRWQAASTMRRAGLCFGAIDANFQARARPTADIRHAPPSSRPRAQQQTWLSMSATSAETRAWLRRQFSRQACISAIHAACCLFYLYTQSRIASFRISALLIIACVRRTPMPLRCRIVTIPPTGTKPALPR